MSNPFDMLKKVLVDKTQSSIGTVSLDKGSVVLIATSLGLTEVPKSGVKSYTSGDSVRIFNGVVVGKVKDDTGLPVYYV